MDDEHVPVVNLEALDPLTDGDRAFQVELLTNFLGEAQEMLAVIGTLLEVDRLDEALQLVHALKGSAASLCLERLAASSVALHDSLLDGMANDPAPELHRLAQELRNVRCATQELLPDSL